MFGDLLTQFLLAMIEVLACNVICELSQTFPPKQDVPGEEGRGINTNIPVSGSDFQTAANFKTASFLRRV